MYVNVQHAPTSPSLRPRPRDTALQRGASIARWDAVRRDGVNLPPGAYTTDAVLLCRSPSVPGAQGA